MRPDRQGRVSETTSSPRSWLEDVAADVDAPVVYARLAGSDPARRGPLTAMMSVCSPPSTGLRSRSVSTAVATLVLALATFSAVRSCHRLALISDKCPVPAAQLWPLLAPARPEDPEQKVMFQDQHKVMVSGGRAAAEATSDSIYFAIAIRNVGPGLAVL